MKKALVRGGGGVVGIAWESGLLAGLADGGVDVRDADCIVGTSAGSVVGTRVAAGLDPTQLGEGREGSRVAGRAAGSGPDMQVLTRIFDVWGRAQSMSRELLAEIGALARGARTIPADEFVEMIARSHGISEWPDRLRVTAVDVESGEFVLHDRESGATLAQAVASSCAVPGMFPPVEINGRYYMDGGVRSGTSADAVLDLQPDVALVVAPIGALQSGIGALAERLMRDEIAQLEAAGTCVCSITPEAAELAAFGPNLMDPAAAEPSHKAGRERGLALAREEASLWNA